MDGFYYNPSYSMLIGEYESVDIHELAIAQQENIIGI